MKDQIEFAIMLFCLGWGVYKYFRKKSERLLYIVIFSASIFSAGYPLAISLEFILSFNGFFGFGVLLYKGLSKNLALRTKALEPLFSTLERLDLQPQRKLKRDLFLSAFLSLFFGVVFLAQGLIYPDLSIPTGNLTFVLLEFALSLCGFFGFGVLLNKISLYKLDKVFIVFDLILFLFGIVCLIQGLFMLKNFL